MVAVGSTHSWGHSRRIDGALALLLFAAGVALRLYLIAPTGFDGLYGQDAYAYYDFAGELRSAIGEHRSPEAFFWPLGYPALLAAAHSLFGSQPATAQTLNILLGAALAPLVYILARQIGIGRPGALSAGLLIGVCGQALQSSIVIMADIPALFWATLSAVLLWECANNSVRARHVLPLPLAALTLALAAVTRWLYLILIIPWLLTVLIGWKGHIRWRESVAALLAGIVILVPQLAYSRTNPYPVLNHAWVEGWSPANAFRQVFNNVDGHFEYSKINSLYYAQPFYEPYYLAPVLTPFIFLGIWCLFRDRRYPALAMLLGWALLPYLFLTGIPYQNLRFPLIVFPAAGALAGCGLDYAARWIGHKVRPPIAYLALFVLVAFGVGQTLTNSIVIINDFIHRQQDDKETAAWAAERIPADAAVYTFGLTLTFQHYTTLPVHELYYETPESLEQKWVRGRPDYLLLNVWNIEHQWEGRDPQRDYHWLRDVRGLVMLGKRGYYTLFMVKG